MDSSTSRPIPRTDRHFSRPNPDLTPPRTENESTFSYTTKIRKPGEPLDKQSWLRKGHQKWRPYATNFEPPLNPALLQPSSTLAQYIPNPMKTRDARPLTSSVMYSQLHQHQQHIALQACTDVLIDKFF